MTALRVALADLPALAGRALHATAPREIGQADVDAFAGLTGDAQWIHTDPQRAASAGGTIVHGLLLLSLIGGAWAQWLEVTDAPEALNYGLDRVRFLAPVRVGSAVTLTATVGEVTVRPDGVRVGLDIAIAVPGAPRLAAVARSIVLFRP